jgi:hypothetical protein
MPHISRTPVAVQADRRYTVTVRGTGGTSTREEALLALVDEESLEIEQLLGDLGRVLTTFDKFSVKTFGETHPRKVYRDISNSISASGSTKSSPTWTGKTQAATPRLKSVLLDAGPALEDAVDLDDHETILRLAAVFDRLEEHLGQR